MAFKKQIDGSWYDSSKNVLIHRSRKTLKSEGPAKGSRYRTVTKSVMGYEAYHFPTAESRWFRTLKEAKAWK